MTTHERSNDPVHLQPRGLLDGRIHSIPRGLDFSHFVAKVGCVDDDLHRFARVALCRPGLPRRGDFGEWGESRGALLAWNTDAGGDAEDRRDGILPSFPSHYLCVATKHLGRVVRS